MNKREIAVHSALLKGEELFNKKNYIQAFPYFLFIARLSPERFEPIQDSFRECYQQVVDSYISDDDTDGLVAFKNNTEKLFIDGKTIYHMLEILGFAFFRLGLEMESLDCFQKARKIDPASIVTTTHAQLLLGRLVQRWHFQMLNDRIRNIAYESSVRSVLEKAHFPLNVLDIGTGIGLLSVFAARTSKAKIHACDYSSVMAEKAKIFIEQNNCQDSITLFNKHSKDLKVPNDLQQKPDLIIMEIFDSGFFGEGVLETLKHCHGLLSTPETMFIPSVVSLYGALIESVDVKHESRVINKDIPLVVDIQINAGGALHGHNFEPYLSENISKYRNKFKFMSDPFEIHKFSLASESDIQELLGFFERIVRVELKSDGLVDGVAFWFTLQMTASPNQHILSSSPFAENRSRWEQAIFPIYPRDDLENEILGVRELSCRGDEVSVKFVLNDGGVPGFLIDGISKQGHDPANIFTFAQMRTVSDLSNCSLLTLDSHLIRKLNDEEYFRCYKNVVSSVLSHICSANVLLAVWSADISFLPHYLAELGNPILLADNDSVLFSRFSHNLQKMLISPPFNTTENVIVVVEPVEAGGTLHQTFFEELSQLRWLIKC